jgi:hypothetical protein
MDWLDGDTTNARVESWHEILKAFRESMTKEVDEDSSGLNDLQITQIMDAHRHLLQAELCLRHYWETEQ